MADGVALNKKVGGEVKYKFAISKPTLMGTVGKMIINEHDMVEHK